jgi:hypothetical protein
VDDAQVVLGMHQSWMVSHVKREANSAAHHLAKFALLCPTEQIWMEEIPKCIYDIVLLEQFPLVVYSFMLLATFSFE